MPTALGTLRRLILAPSLTKVSFAGRAFPAASLPQAAALQAVARAVVCGFEWAIESLDVAEAVHRTELVTAELRGFAYEGVTMAFTVADVIDPRGGRRTETLLRGPARSHLLLAYIGIGFAMARLPRRLWQRVLPDLTGLAYHPVMSWLAVDGYGFDLAYFHTAEYVTGQRRPPAYPWQGCPGYFQRAVDQGIGRALWFIHGGQAEHVDAAVRRFTPQRRGDLYSGVGLAASFAGGADGAALSALRDLAADQWPHLAQGAVFAAKARHEAGFVPGYTEVAVAALAGLTVAQACQLADQTQVDAALAGPLPAYEIWRAGVRSSLPARA